jgi:hypothetical protein
VSGESATPVSWLMIEPGWTVVAADGTDVGTVDEVVGDNTNDIFNGLAIVSGLFAKARYVPSEHVGTITEGRVALTMSGDAIERLGEYEQPPASVEFLPEDASIGERLQSATTARIHTHEENVSFLRKLRVALARLLRSRR